MPYTTRFRSTGQNLFGESYTTDSVTTYSYYDAQSGPHGVYGELKGAVTTSTTIGKDIWGATYTTDSNTTYQIINNRALASVVTSHTTGQNLFGESYTTDSVTTYSY